MSELAGRLTRTLQRAGLPVVGVAVGTSTDRATWRINFGAGATVEQQEAASALIAAYDPAAPDPVDDAAQLNAQVTAALDQDRLISAVVWTIIDTYSAPATIPKYTAARTKIINNFKVQPWK